MGQKRIHQLDAQVAVDVADAVPLDKSSNPKAVKMTLSDLIGSGLPFMRIATGGALQSAGVGLGAVVGNARGSGAIDLQTKRSLVTQVASGSFSSITGGYNNTVSGFASHAEGSKNNNSGDWAHIEGCYNINIGNLWSGTYAHIEGFYNTNSAAMAHVEGAYHLVSQGGPITESNPHVEGQYNVCTGYFNHVEGSHNTGAGPVCHVEGLYSSASGYGSHAGGVQSKSTLRGQFSRSNGRFAAFGDAQYSFVILRKFTDDAVATELTLDGNAPGSHPLAVFLGDTDTNNRIVVPSDKTFLAFVKVIARNVTPAEAASFLRYLVIENRAGTTALVGSVQTIGSDIGSNAGVPPVGWAVTITADNVNDSLKIKVTGAALTNIRWVAQVELVEVGYCGPSCATMPGPL